MRVDRPVGIDLGTTNSEIALLEPSERGLVLYADRFGRKTVPSALAWDDKASAWVVGHAARQRRGAASPPIESIKRKMGQSVRVKIGPHELLPEEVAGHLLSELRERMREHLSTKAAAGVELVVRRAVITVPAYFDGPQVEATRKAGELAGLDVIGILQEPTAAAIYHTWKSRLGEGNYLVYDLGGGTFDVSILRCVGGEYQVLAIDGDNYLGGDDLDRRFAERLRKTLASKGYALELDVRANPDDQARFLRLVHLAQEVKEALSTNEVLSLSKQDILVDQTGEGVAFEGEIGRAEYEEAVADLVETTLRCCERALARSKEVGGVGLEDVDHVILVGGSTRVPLVVRRVTESLCAPSKAKKPLQDEVDTCVALGAAIHAAQLGGLGLEEGGARLTLVTPLVGSGKKLRLGVKATAPGARRVVASKGGAAIAEADLDVAKPDQVVRLELPLDEAPETRVSLEVLGDVTTSFPLELYRGDVRPRASALSRPSVVAKDLSVEVTRAGRRERKVLVARGSGLPAETHIRLFTGDQSGAVVLRVLQNRLPIKTLMFTVPRDLAIGTPVDLLLKCDESMRIEARAEVAGQKLWANIEPPKEERFDLEGRVEALLEEAELAAKNLWGSYGNAYRREHDELVAQIREVIAVDPDKLSALCSRLRLLIDEFKGATKEDLSPPMHHLEGVLDRLRRIVYRSRGPLMGLDQSAWEERVRDLEQRAFAAYEAGEASAWRRINNEAQALAETVVQEEFAQQKLDEPAYVSRRVLGLLGGGKYVEERLEDFVASSAEEVRALQVAERDRLLAVVREKILKPLADANVERDVAEARRACDLASAELDSVDKALERLPSLGLVTERG